MAIPPEPIEEVLPHAELVIEAEVLEILGTGPLPPKRESNPGATSMGHKVPSQTVKLKVTKVHKGPSSLKEVVVEKPAAGYLLKAGNKGPFLLDAGKPNPTILGRYGPDSWALSRVVNALGGAK